MDQWGDSWAVLLWSGREESRLPQYVELEKALSELVGEGGGK
jgi:hypothetical protein